MPAGNKPKRLDRAWAWRVGRRKKELKELLYGKTRSRAKRPKVKVKTQSFD
jgi:hypothetical protein